MTTGKTHLGKASLSGFYLHDLSLFSSLRGLIESAIRGKYGFVYRLEVDDAGDDQEHAWTIYDQQGQVEINSGWSRHAEAYTTTVIASSSCRQLAVEIEELILGAGATPLPERE